MLKSQISSDPHLVILCIMDNNSSKNWTLYTSKQSIIDRALARFFCGLLIGSDDGIDAKWISTVSYKIADKISRINKSNTPLSFHFAFSELQQDYAELNHCCYFQPSPELLSIVWEVLLTQNCQT
jgi:hypothetical protein